MALARPRADLSPVSRIQRPWPAIKQTFRSGTRYPFGMKWKTLLYALALSALLVSFYPLSESKKVIIHVPYRVKNVKHVHTVYKIIPHYHEEEKEEEIEEDDKYESY